MRRETPGRPADHTFLHVVLRLTIAAVLILACMTDVCSSASSGAERRVSLAGYGVAKKKKKPHRAVTTPILVQDIRVTPYPDHTRLVFDLKRQVIFTQHHQQQSRRVVIELQNAQLGRTAKARLTDGEIPQPVAVAQASRGQSHAVTISLDLDAVSDYKLLPLDNPSRLVVDLYEKIPQEEASIMPPPAAVERAQATPPARRQTARKVKTIVIDAGHGGKDPGAIGRGGTAEKDITLKVALLLRDLIIAQLGKQVFLTRDRDVFVELEDRATFANKHEADLFVSIHVNSHPQRATKGLEVYHFGEASDPRALAVAARENNMPIETMGTGLPYILADLLTTKKMDESRDLAWFTKQALVSHLTGHYEIIDHGVKAGPFYVLRFTSMPSILAEIAFISNPTEERLMQGRGFLDHIAEGILAGIKAFIGPAQVAVGGDKAVRG